HHVVVGPAWLQGGGVEGPHARSGLHGHVVDEQLGVGRQFDDELGACRNHRLLIVVLLVRLRFIGFFGAGAGSWGHRSPRHSVNARTNRAMMEDVAEAPTAVAAPATVTITVTTTVAITL